MPPQRREELLLEFERSGPTASKFAELAGVRYQTSANWVQDHQKRRATKGTATGAALLSFAEVERAGVAPPCGMLRVVLPGGGSIGLRELSQIGLAAQLIKALV